MDIRERLFRGAFQEWSLDFQGLLPCWQQEVGAKEEQLAVPEGQGSYLLWYREIMCAKVLHFREDEIKLLVVAERDHGMSVDIAREKKRA